MAVSSKIAWTRSTFNPWIGCTKVGPGCDHCYAEALDKRMRYGGGEHWGQGVARLHTSLATWKQVLTWNARAARGERPWRVFCASLADVFDNEIPDAWRAELWQLILRCQQLDWLIVTKRVGNVAKMVPAEWIQRGFPAAVRLLITVCNQEEADRDIPKLLALPCKNGVSYEPALGPIDFCPDFGNYDAWDYLRGKMRYGEAGDAAGVGRGVVVEDTRRLEWVIVGGESSQASGKARPFDRQWAYSTIQQCRTAGVPVFVKQLGSNVLARNDGNGCDIYQPHYLDRAGANPAEWPEDLRVQEFPV